MALPASCQELSLPIPCQVLDVAAIVLGEALEAGSTLVEVLGPLLGTDTAKGLAG